MTSDAHRHVGDGQADPLQPAGRGTAIRSPRGISAPLPSTTRCTTPWKLGVTTAEMDADPNAPHENAPRLRLESGARAGDLDSRRAPSRQTPRSRRGRARKIKRELEKFGVAKEPGAGVDVIELPILFAPRRRASGYRRRSAAVRGGSPHQDGRRRSPPPLTGGVDGGCRVRGARAAAFGRASARTRPSASSRRRCTTWALEYVEGVNAISGERCSPAPPRLQRPAYPAGDPALFFDILHSFNGYRTCYYRHLRGGIREHRAARRVHPRPRVHGSSDRHGPARQPPRRGHRQAVADRAGVRLPRRGGGLLRCSTPASACRSGRSRSSPAWCCRLITRVLQGG